MATTSNRRSALAAFKERHPVLQATIDESGNISLRVDSLVDGTRDRRLFHSSKNLFHPIASYNRSVSRVTRRASAFADKLFDFESAHRNLAYSPQTKAVSDAYKTLLDLYEAFLFALESHFDDLKGIAACFWEEPPKKVRSANWNRFSIELEAISNASAYLVNKIKHNQATLCAFHSVAATNDVRLAVPGFLLQRVVGDSVGPDPDFGGYENSAISFFGDFRRTLLTLLAASEALADYLVDHGVTPDLQRSTSDRWNDVFDVLYSISRLVYPSEKHEFLMETNLVGFSHRRFEMLGSIRAGPPPAGLQCNEWSVLYEGDGYTRSFRLPRPIQMKP